MPIVPAIRSFDPAASTTAGARAQPSEAVRAQRLALFQQAIAGAAVPAAAPPQATMPAVSVTPVTRINLTEAPDPARPLRPGSLLDIRV